MLTERASTNCRCLRTSARACHSRVYSPVVETKTVSQMTSLLLLGVVCLVRAAHASENDPPPTLKLVTSFSLPNPAFLSLYGYASGDGYDLLVSSFSANPLGTDRVYRVKHVEKFLQKNSTQITPQVLTESVVWPNEVTGVYGTFGGRTVAVAGGFFIPLKERGTITLIDVSGDTPGKPYVITDQSEKWFYHRVEWFDMNADGHADALTCRAEKPLLGSAKGQLVWFQNENGLNQSTPWKSHVIAEGPDIFFESVPYVNTTEGYIQAIFVAQFFSPALKVFWVGTSGNWSDTSKINQRIIDKSIGQVFDVDFCDVNGDENMDLLVTANSATNGTVWAYEIPRDFRTGVYKRHLLASGFKSRSGEIGKGAPGSAQLIYTRQETGYKASILLSGDDAGQAFILNPRSEAKDDWTYTVTPFLDAGSGTVGGIDYADVDRDDHKEIFVPAYNENKVYIYRA
ncbi:hypothetical protein BaRGS_00019844 [Batillaria attramentaria]|uniref:Uncharacterized protein n=1 Tax=Batillaria attramentaria TaxID=370345 RepID=A0ABD0KP37_9CAEN